MYVDGILVVPAHVTHVEPWGLNKKTRASRGCKIHLVSGKVIYSQTPATQAIAILGLMSLTQPAR